MGLKVQYTGGPHCACGLSREQVRRGECQDFDCRDDFVQRERLEKLEVALRPLPVLHREARFPGEATLNVAGRAYRDELRSQLIISQMVDESLRAAESVRRKMTMIALGSGVAVSTLGAFAGSTYGIIALVISGSVALWTMRKEKHDG